MDYDSTMFSGVKTSAGKEVPASKKKMLHGEDQTPVSDCKECNKKSNVLKMVWEVLSRQEQIYDRLDEQVEWLTLFCLTAPIEKNGNTANKRAHYTACRKRLNRYFNYHGEEVIDKIVNNRLDA